MTATENDLLTPDQARAVLGGLIGRTPSRGTILRWRRFGLAVNGRVVKLAAARTVGNRQLIARAACEAFAAAVVADVPADPDHAPESPAHLDARAAAAMREYEQLTGHRLT